MSGRQRDRIVTHLAFSIVLMTALHSACAGYETIGPSPYWKNQVDFPYDAFCNRGVSKDAVKWIKFTILLEPYDPNVVYFQDCSKKQFAFHYGFAAEVLDPFRGMTASQFNAATLFEKNQKAILGTVILPPAAVWPTQPQFREYGIQFVRQDPFTREQIRDLFQLVKACVAAPADVQVFYFPTYEQQAAALANRDWFEAQGISLSSTARWAEGNACYSQGWAFGRLNHVPAGSIASAYHDGTLLPGDILLTDGVPAEVPFVAGIISLASSTPNSHVAILSRTYMVPFVHLTLAADTQRAQQLVGHRIVYSAYEDDFGADVWIMDTDGLLDEATAAEILQLKSPASLHISPMASAGVVGMSTEGLHADDMRYVGGKAANFGILRAAVPENSPKAVALTFDLWNAFLDQPLAPAPAIAVGPGEHTLFWADGDAGPMHTSFRLSKDGESVYLFDVDGVTLLDSIQFGPQADDISYGRSSDGGDTWQPLSLATPGSANSTIAGESDSGLVINELMASNDRSVEDPCRPGEYPDWIELYNGSDELIALNGMYLTDDVNAPTLSQVQPEIAAPILRDEIARRLSAYASYPPADMQQLSRDLASVRALFANPNVSEFSDFLRGAVIDVLTDPAYGFDPAVTLRFRSSTNVEDSVDFIGAGLYDSYSGCLADALDGDDAGPCGCDPNRRSERDVFQAIRQVFASFYNDNAFLERLRRGLDEGRAGMAVVVHHSFPDEIELANGVATVDKQGAEGNTYITLVSQQGAVSVTNPADASTPEEVTVTVLPSGSIVPPKLARASSLVRVGDTVMTWSGDYTELATLLIRVSDEFSRSTGKTQYILDLEYKKVAPGGSVLPAGGLVIKQVRQVPSSDRAQVPYLVNRPTQFEVYPGEVELLEEDDVDVFADHRLKSRWTIQTRNRVLDANALNDCLYTDVQIEYLDEDQIRTVSGTVATLPAAGHNVNGNETVDSWHWSALANPRAYYLRTSDVPVAVPSSQRPILTPSDLGHIGYRVPYHFLALDVAYAGPVVSWRASGMRSTTSNHAYLWACSPPEDGDIPQERAFGAGGVSIQSYFYYPPLPRGLTMWELGGANTAPLKRWDRSIIEGLATEPIVLKGYYSQTFRPEHHNLVEHFLFEPRLEPGISSEILAQLQAKGIRFIHLILDKDNTGADLSRIVLYDFNGSPITLDAEPPGN